MMDTKKLLTKQEAAEYLRVNGRTLMRWVKAGELSAHRVGNHVRFYEHELEEYLSRHTIVSDESD